jgi:hypothetical protein
MDKRNVLIGYRIFFALLALSAVVTELSTLAERGTLVPVNFFSFFTIESNIFAAGVLILSSLALARDSHDKSLAMLRGATTLYMAITGIVFSVLLAGLDDQLTAVPWDNTVLHYIMPIAVAADWFIDLPKIRIALKSALVWLAFPIAYVAYSLIRGHFATWYPYPFLNPSKQGYIGVATTCAAIVLGATTLVWLLTRFTPRNTVKEKT